MKFLMYVCRKYPVIKLLLNGIIGIASYVLLGTVQIYLRLAYMYTYHNTTILENMMHTYILNYLQYI